MEHWAIMSSEVSFPFCVAMLQSQYKLYCVLHFLDINLWNLSNLLVPSLGLF